MTIAITADITESKGIGNSFAGEKSTVHFHLSVVNFKVVFNISVYFL